MYQEKDKELYGSGREGNPSCPYESFSTFLVGIVESAFLKDASQVPREGHASPPFEKLDLSSLTA